MEHRSYSSGWTMGHVSKLRLHRATYGGVCMNALWWEWRLGQGCHCLKKTCTGELCEMCSVNDVMALIMMMLRKGGGV